MNQQNLNNGRCRKINHAQSKFIKFCKHENCQDRMLCVKCDESGVHQNHENYDPKQIVYLIDIHSNLECYINNEQQYLQQLEQIQKQAKFILENIQIMFESFINEIRGLKDEQTRYLFECAAQQTMLEINTINQDEIQTIIQKIGADNNKMNIDNLRQKIISIQDYVHDEFEFIQDTEDFVKYYRLQKLQDQIIDANLEKCPSIYEIKKLNYTSDQLDNQFEQIYALDIAKSQEFIALAVKVQDGFYLKVYNSQQKFKRKCQYQHDCKIFSLKFCSQSKDIYFGDEQGYLSIYKVKEEKIFSQIQIQKDIIDQIVLVSSTHLLTIFPQNKEIVLSDITDHDMKGNFLVGHYAFQSHCNLAYSNLNLVYPSYTSICVQNIYEREPFIKQEISFLQPKLPLQLEISQLGDQILICQGQEIRRWAINHEQKKLELQNFIFARKNILNISFILNDQYILYDNIDSLGIVQVVQNEQIKQIQLNQFEHELEKPYYLKQLISIDFLCIIRKNKVIVLSKSVPWI